MVILDEREKEAAEIRRALAARETARQVCHHARGKGAVACGFALLSPRVDFYLTGDGTGRVLKCLPARTPTPLCLRLATVHCTLTLRFSYVR